MGQNRFLHLLLVSMFTMSYASDLLQNLDFKIPPPNTNTTTNSTSRFLLLTQETPIPGWSFNGTVYYISSGTNNLSLPGGGHAVQLAENGLINQTIEGAVSATPAMDHVLTFTLGGLMEGGSSCDGAAVNINLDLNITYDVPTPYNLSSVFYFQRNPSGNPWEIYAMFLGRIRKGDSINIEISSVGTDSRCWPFVDGFIVQVNEIPRFDNGNKLSNGGFEIGPAFPEDSSDGILLNSENSPLQQWDILGTIRYIDSSTHYKIPQGKAAVQLLSGSPSSGIRLYFFPKSGSTHTLNFTMGDANDSCIGDFVLHLQVGKNVIQNFTMRSNGTGSGLRHSVTLRSDDLDSKPDTLLSFYSLNATLRSDGVICGPVLDDIVLVGSQSSDGNRIKLCNGVSIFRMVFALILVFVLA